MLQLILIAACILHVMQAGCIKAFKRLCLQQCTITRCLFMGKAFDFRHPAGRCVWIGGSAQSYHTLFVIMQESLKSVIAQYNASQLLTMREVCIEHNFSHDLL